MKEKILAAIKAMFPTINLSKKRLDAIAAKIEAKVIDDETKIDAALKTFDEYNPLAEMAKLDDALRNYQAKEKERGKNTDPQETPAQKAAREAEEAKTAAEGAASDKDTPLWAKSLIEQNKKLAESVAAIQGEKVANTIKTKATEKLKDVPVSYWGKRALPEKEEDLDAFVTDVTADYTAFKQELTDQGLSVLSVPKIGGGEGADNKKKASKEEVDAVVNNIM